MNKTIRLEKVDGGWMVSVGGKSIGFRVTKRAALNMANGHTAWCKKNGVRL